MLQARLSTGEIESPAVEPPGWKLAVRFKADGRVGGEEGIVGYLVSNKKLHCLPLSMSEDHTDKESNQLMFRKTLRQ